LAAIMNPAHCAQCGRAVSEVDRAGGSCPWCGRTLVSIAGPRPSPARHRYTPPSNTSSGRSGWSYWWIPLVAFLAIRGMMACSRTMNRPHRSNNTNEYRFTPPPTFDHERFRDVLEGLKEARRLQELRESREDPFAEPRMEIDEDWLPVADELREHRAILERGGETDSDAFSEPGDHTHSE
jgi:hypothetical protein